MGVQDERRDRQRRAVDCVGPGVCRRPRRILFRARREDGEPAVEVRPRWSGGVGTNELRGQRPAVRRGVSRKQSVRVRAAAIAAAYARMKTTAAITPRTVTSVVI